MSNYPRFTLLLPTLILFMAGCSSVEHFSRNNYEEARLNQNFQDMNAEVFLDNRDQSITASNISFMPDSVSYIGRFSEDTVVISNEQVSKIRFREGFTLSFWNVWGFSMMAGGGILVLNGNSSDCGSSSVACGLGRAYEKVTGVGLFLLGTTIVLISSTPDEFYVVTFQE